MAAKKKPTRHHSAIKAYRQSVRRYTRNRAVKKSIRLAVRATVDAAASKDSAQTGQLLSKAAQVLDKAAQRGVVHWKTVARKKSRLAKRVASQLAAASPAATSAK